MATAKRTLSYPLYCVDFDPLNHNYLYVAGGGGEGRSGVGNKITLLDTSKQEEITETTDIELSRNEDSPTSLAVVDTSETSATIYAGINSSVTQQNEGKNEHLRSFRIDYPSKDDEAGEDKAPEEKSPSRGRITPIGQASLFYPSSAARKETYQRITRLSPFTKDGKARIAAIASGLSPRGQLLLLNTLSNPAPSMVVDRIDLSKDEAADVDIIQEEGSEDLLVAFCTKDDVLVYRVRRGSPSSESGMPYYVHTIPPKDVFDPNPERPSNRSLRFLTHNRLLLLQNLPGKTGVEILVLALNNKDLGTITFRRRLHRSMKAAVALTVCALNRSPQGDQQFAIAVAGTPDISIEILTLNYSPSLGLGKFTVFKTLRDVHPLQITGLTFSTYFPPPMPASAATPPQYIKLASVSMGNTVVVHTFPLYPWPSIRSRTPQYLLSRPSRADTAAQYFAVFFAIFVVCFAAFLFQAFLEIRGGSPAHLGAAEYLPTGLRQVLERPYILSHNPPIPTEMPPVLTAQEPNQQNRKPKLTDLHSQLVAASAAASSQSSPSSSSSSSSSSDLTDEAIIVRDADAGVDADTSEVSAELLQRPDAEKLKKEGARRWEELSEEEKTVWRTKLEDAGHWVREEGEAILKGVVFGELAGMVAEAVR